MKKAKKIKPIHSDKRGNIIKVAEDEITSVLLINSKKGSVRANHYHKNDTHYMYLLSGKMRYVTKSLKGKSARKQSVVLKPGEIVFTPKMLAHAMIALVDSQFLALTKKSRKKAAYENDTVKYELVSAQGR